MYQLMWFRRDLRVHDNPAAMRNGATTGQPGFSLIVHRTFGC